MNNEEDDIHLKRLLNKQINAQQIKNTENLREDSANSCVHLWSDLHHLGQDKVLDIPDSFTMMLMCSTWQRGRVILLFYQYEQQYCVVYKVHLSYNVDHFLTLSHREQRGNSVADNEWDRVRGKSGWMDRWKRKVNRRSGLTNVNNCVFSSRPFCITNEKPAIHNWMYTESSLQFYTVVIQTEKFLSSSLLALTLPCKAGVRRVSVCGLKNSWSMISGHSLPQSLMI